MIQLSPAALLLVIAPYLCSLGPRKSKLPVIIAVLFSLSGGIRGPWCLLGLERGYLGLGFYILWPVEWPRLLCPGSDVLSVKWLVLP